MHQKCLAGRGGESGKPAKQLASSRVSRKLANRGHFRLHRDVLSMDAQKPDAILQSASAGAFTLIADQ